MRLLAWQKTACHFEKLRFLLTDEGIPTPDGKSLWRYQSIRNILNNPFYIGRAAAYKTRTEFIPGEGRRKTPRSEDEWVAFPEGTVPPIIDEETFETVQLQLTRNSQNSPRNNPHPQDTLLRCGMVICGSCGHNLTVDRSKSRGRTRIRYRCPRAHKGYKECPEAPDIAASLLDSLVWKEALATIRNPSKLDDELAKQGCKTPQKTNSELLTCS